ncbi:MAG: hypothetical protein JRH20_20875 [Deltaproteobacteria bacterium]|nr:hypothetical protein [Deltaproteobacteria bacterium]
MRISILVLTSLLALPSGWSQPQGRTPRAFWHRPLPPPALMVRQNNRSQPLKLSEVKIDAKIVGHLAETTMTMTFYNPNSAVMEGDLYFPLPEGAAVSGYALDVHGAMVEGVVVDKDKGRQVFETEVRKGIDPGLVEWTKGSNFKTRVFPIPGRGTRTIRVSTVSETETIRGQATYYLPLSFRDRVGKLSLRVEVVKAVVKPVVAHGGPKGLSFSRWHDSFVTQATLKNAQLKQDLYIALPRNEERPVRVERAPDGEVYFAIRHRPQEGTRANAGAPPKRIAVYWDASLSRAKADHKSELALLDAYLKRLGQARVEAVVVLFSNAAERPRRFKLPAQRQALLTMLRAVRYDGGTQIGALPRVRGASLNLLFSDGVSNFGLEDPVKVKTPIYTINSTSTASHDLLRYLALRTGGAYFNLRRVSPEKAAQKIGAPAFSFLRADAKNNETAGIYPSLPTPVQGSFDLVGKLKGHEAALTLHFGYGKQATSEKSFVISRQDAVAGNILRRAWAQKKVAELMIFPERNAERISEVGRDYGIVTAETSLIVLETLSQYLQHEIHPPASLKKMRAQYEQTMAQRKQSYQRKQASKLQHVLRLWEQRVNWWNTRFKYPKNYRYGVRARKKRRPRRRAARPRSRRHSSAKKSVRARPSPAPAMSEAREAPMAKTKGKRGGKNAQRPQPSITIKAWDPKTPYIAAIKAAPASKRYAVYLEQRKKHGAAPAFYLDCAHTFRRQKRAVIALRILSNLAELELENPALMRVLAHRLAQIGELDLSAQLFDAVRRLRPEEPQSFRDLALVLERRADKTRAKRQRGARQAAKNDYKRALELLAKVVMQRWQRFNEIEVIALTELNNILPKARRVGLQQIPVDPRLVKHLNMDVRIVMTWDADNTDMDLHVVEPSNEKAYYGHNRTRIGGLVSRDFTRGYGPEVYAVRRAMRGRYKIRTKFYALTDAPPHRNEGNLYRWHDLFLGQDKPNERVGPPQPSRVPAQRTPCGCPDLGRGAAQRGRHCHGHRRQHRSAARAYRRGA